LKSILFKAAVLCLLALSMGGISAGADTASSENQVLKSYEGNLSEKQIVPVDMVSLYGAPGFFFAETVKFKAPKPGWKLNAVQVSGWDGYNGSAETAPANRVIGLEIRDKDLNLLYKFADSQIPYSNYARNFTGVFEMTIEVPSVPVSDEFYVCFYDRGAVAVGSEQLNEMSDNSFVYISEGLPSKEKLLPAKINIDNSTALPINWLMNVVGS